MTARPVTRLALVVLLFAACGGSPIAPTGAGGSGDAAAGTGGKAGGGGKAGADAAAGADGGAGADAAAGTGATDATSGDVGPGDVGPDGSGLFTVAATLTVTPPAGQESAWINFPRTHTFTIFVDPRALRTVVGALGRATAVALASPRPGAFETFERVTVPAATGACGGYSVNYDVLSFAVAGGRLTGTGRGTGFFVTGDVVWSAPVTATLDGVPDVDLPTLSIPADTIEPMGGAFFGASEPLGDSSAASLIGGAGDVFALGAQVQDGPPRFTTGFVRSPLMLNWDTTYEVTTEALVDLGGHMGSRQARPKVKTPAAPPLVAEDGFESVTTTTFAGAGVIATGSLSPLAGTKSLIVNGGTNNFGYLAGPRLGVRLPIQAGDTTVRFSARLVGTYAFADQVTFYGAIRAGVPGREVSSMSNLTAKVVKTTLANGSEAYLGPVTTIELPVSLGSIGEASFEISAQLMGCGLPPPPVALIVDDLRLE